VFVFATTRLLTEVLEVAARRWAALALILGANGTGSVGVVGGRRHTQETDLTNFHAGVQRDGQRRRVRQFQGDVTVESGVDEPGRRVNYDAQPTQTGLPLDARHEVIGDAHSLGRCSQHELAGVEDEDIVGSDLDEFGEVLLVFLHVNNAGGVVAKHPEVAVNAKVNRRRLHVGRFERIDHDPSGGNLFSKGAIRQDHGAQRSCPGTRR
jgi:hypothetical protein